MAALQKKTRQVLELISSCQAWADMDACMQILKCDEMEILDAVDELKEQGLVREQQDDETVRFFSAMTVSRNLYILKCHPQSAVYFTENWRNTLKGCPFMRQTDMKD